MTNAQLKQMLEEHIEQYNALSSAIASFIIEATELFKKQDNINKQFYDQFCSHVETFKSLEGHTNTIAGHVNAHKTLLIEQEQRIKNLEEQDDGIIGELTHVREH